jgi:Uma2 family endonuclease
MSTAVASRTTTAELLAMPENGVDRWLIGGKLRERPMTKRNRFHSRAVGVIAAELEIWLRTQPEPRGQILVGEAGIILRHDPDTTVGIDVAYVSAEVIARQTDDTTLIDGLPNLAVEVLSPSDTVKDIDEIVCAYLDAGVPLVWIIDPHVRTATVYRSDVGPELFNEHQELIGEPHLPGFRVPMARLFV